MKLRQKLKNRKKCFLPMIGSDTYKSKMQFSDRKASGYTKN